MSIEGRSKPILSAAVYAVALAGTPMSGACAAQAEPTWKGKTFKVIIRTGPGGGFDFYGRLLSRHMTKYLPDTPNSIAINMAGAGGTVAANYLMNRAKKDGTEIAILARDLAIAQRTGGKGIRFDVTRMISIGSAASSTWTWVIRDDHPVKSLSQLKSYKGVVKFGATGMGSSTYLKTKFLVLAGFPVTMITGYDGTQEKILAIARGEVDATSGAYESLRSAIRGEKLTVLGRMGNHPDLQQVERARNVMTGEARALAAFMAAPLIAGRPFLAPPGVNKGKVKALRVAFKNALEDSQLVTEAKKAKRSIDYTSGEEMEEIYKDIIGASDKVVAQFKAL